LNHLPTVMEQVNGGKAEGSEGCSTRETSCSHNDEQSQSDRLEWIKDQVSLEVSNLRKDLTKEIASDIEGLRAKVKQQEDARLTHAIKDFRGQVEKQISDIGPRLTHVTKAHVDKQISDLQLHLAQMKGEGVSDQISEMRAQMQELRMQLSERSVQPELDAGTTPRTNWEEFREASWSATLGNLQRLGAATKDHVDGKLCALGANCYSCKCKDGMHQAKMHTSDAMSEFQEQQLSDCDVEGRNEEDIAKPIYPRALDIMGRSEEEITKQIFPRSEKIVIL